MVLVERSHPLNSPNNDRTLQTPQTANCLQQRFAIALPSTSQTAIPTERFAIAPPQLPKSELLAAALRYRTPPTSQTAIPTERFAIAPLPRPNSDSYGALRYRTPSTSQTAIPTERFAIALPPTSQIAIASPQLPNILF